MRLLRCLLITLVLLIQSESLSVNAKPKEDSDKQLKNARNRPSRYIKNSVRKADPPAIGRALESSGNIKRADLLTVDNVNEYTGKYICFSMALITTNHNCPPVKYEINFVPTSSRCLPKTQLRVLEPEGFMISSDKPRFQWTGVEEATEYRVQIKVPIDRKINYTAVDNIAEFPKDELPIRTDTINLFTVVAYSETGPIAYGKKAFKVIDQKTNTRIKTLVPILESLGMNREELVKDLDSIYIGKGLRQESIALLNSLISANNRDPELSLLLGDRYYASNSPVKALTQYTRAYALAKSKNSPIFLSITRDRITLLKESKRSDRFRKNSANKEGQALTAKKPSEPFKASC